MKKIRLDLLLVNLNLSKSREESQRWIRAGKVLVNESVIDKPGFAVQFDSQIRIKSKESSYVSRGGLKLEHALKSFSLDIHGQIVADLGASTGGFTDCLLRFGVQKVYAVDVGHGQLDYRLQTDPRVIVKDRTNCRYLTLEALGEWMDLVVADLSFISLKTVFPAVQQITRECSKAIFLIKPQFEIGKGRVGKGGIVKKTSDHLEVLRDFYQFIIEQGWCVKGMIPSPILGKSGNREFLIYIHRISNEPSIPWDAVETTAMVHNGSPMPCS